MYGINAYRSNAMYTSLLSSNYSNKKNTQTNSTSDLLALMKKVDQVRSKDYQKNMINEYKKAFSGSDVGTYESEKKLSSDASNLSKSASVLASASKADFEDKDKLTENVKNFVEDYNTTVDSLQKSESVDALKKGVYMTNTAKAYSASLGRIGLRVGTDNKITLNEDTLKSADTNVVKSLLGGNYSFTSKAADKASQISKAANLKAQVVNYNQEGKFDFSTMFSLSSMFSEKI
ncbi:MAG: hypothetical protein ACI4I1_11655 [Oscillospiraceae bacterium]